MDSNMLQMSNGTLAYLLLMSFLLGGWVASLVGLVLSGVW